jgi:hypothetical protein
LHAEIVKHCGEDDSYAEAAKLNTQHMDRQSKQHLRRLGWGKGAAND